MFCGATHRNAATFTSHDSSLVAPFSRVLPLFPITNPLLWCHSPECCHFFRSQILFCGATHQSAATFSGHDSSLVAPFSRVLPLFPVTNPLLWRHSPECCHFFRSRILFCGATHRSAATFSGHESSFVAPLTRVLPLFQVMIPHLWRHSPECSHYFRSRILFCGATHRRAAAFPIFN
ncbi:hypothetical protein RKD52_003052 [Metabacillus sp. SLBN-84]